MSAMQADLHADDATQYVNVIGLDSLFSPRGIAIFGASSDPTKIGGRPLRFLKESGFSGGVYPINPRYDEVQGVKAYASLDDIDDVVDLALIAISGDAAIDAVRACGEHGVKVATVFSAGFAETGDEGMLAQQRLVEAAKIHGVRLLGPNCIGSMNNRNGAVGTFAVSVSIERTRPALGRIALVSQSGAIASEWVVRARDMGIEFDPWLSTGNESDIQLADCLAYFALDDEVDVIAAYMEGCRDGDRLREALKIARDRNKAVVMLKVGRSDVGAKAAASHTASLVGSDEVFDALFDQYGVIRVDSMDELVDVASALSIGLLPRGNRLGLLTSSGGVGILMADSAADVGLQVPVLAQEVQDELKAIWAPAGVLNPIDMTAQVMNSKNLLSEFLNVVLRGDNFDAVVVSLTYMGLFDPWADQVIAELAAARAANPDTPIFVATLSSEKTRRALEALRIPVFEDPSIAVSVVGRLCALGSRAESASELSSPLAEAPADLNVGEPITEVAALRILSEAGIPVVRQDVVRSAAAATAAATAGGGAVVLKIVSADIAHKTEVGGVALNIMPADAAAAYAELLAAVAQSAPDAKIDGVLVAPMITDGVETILGVFNDPAFGPVVVFGLGGVFVEVLRDVTYRLAPFDTDVAEQMIREIKGFALLDGARNLPRADIGALAEALSNLSYFAAAHRVVLDSIDINPFLVRPVGSGGMAADALILTNSEPM